MLRILLPVLLLLLGACATSTVSVSPPQADAAERLYREGDFAAAARAFVEAADAPRAPRERYLLRAAESWREEGRLDLARSTLVGLPLGRLSPALRARAGLILAEAALLEGDADAALAQLAGAPPQGAAALRHFELRARAHALRGEALEAAAARAQLDLRLDEGERADNARELLNLLASLDDARLLAAGQRLGQGDPLRSWLGAALSRRGVAVPWSDQTRDAWPDPRLGEEADGYAPPRRIALLLPEAGPLAAAGRSVRDGLLAAYYAEGRLRPELRMYDSGIDVAQALAAFDRASADGADLIVGPLGREEVAALFERGALRTPVLALNRGGAVPPPPGSVSFSLSPDEEAAAAAERFTRRGIGRVIVIGAGDEASQRSVEAFVQRFEQRGGDVVARARLPDGDPNFGPVLSRAFGHLVAPTPPALLWSIEGEPPVPDFEGVFLALRPAQARLLIPQLKVIGIEGLPMFAGSSIQGAESDPRLDRELDGIEFTTLPWLIDAAIGVPRREHLAADLDSAQGAAARLFAFGIDAFRLSAYLHHLSSVRGAHIFGATGELSLDGFGNVLRVPAWARFRNGRAQAAEGALQADGRGP
jgi:uncharacterized protein